MKLVYLQQEKLVAGSAAWPACFIGRAEGSLGHHSGRGGPACCEWELSPPAASHIQGPSRRPPDATTQTSASSGPLWPPPSVPRLSLESGIPPAPPLCSILILEAPCVPGVGSCP